MLNMLYLICRLEHMQTTSIKHTEDLQININLRYEVFGFF